MATLPGCVGCREPRGAELARARAQVREESLQLREIRAKLVHAPQCVGHLGEQGSRIRGKPCEPPLLLVELPAQDERTRTHAASDVVISDSLSARLEYITGSAQTDRPANFTAAENEVGSVIVRWDLPGSLLPGQSGTIKFKAKVR